MLKSFLNHVQKVLKIQSKIDFKNQIRNKAINEKKDVVLDDEVNYRKRRPNLVGSEIKADFNMKKGEYLFLKQGLMVNLLTRVSKLT